MVFDGDSDVVSTLVDGWRSDTTVPSAKYVYHLKVTNRFNVVILKLPLRMFEWILGIKGRVVLERHAHPLAEFLEQAF